jgi:hypothetical protein
MPEPQPRSSFDKQIPKKRLFKNNDQQKRPSEIRWPFTISKSILVIEL